MGEVAHLGGKILDAKGDPLRTAVIEIWQCDRDGTYLKQYTRDHETFDTNFQGYGRFLSGSTGEFDFRTINLHKGRDTGKAWSTVIDVSAIGLTVISLTGLVLLLSLKRKRLPGLLVVVGGAVALFLTP